MRNLDVDDDIWEDLVRNREGFETISEQLRRRLGIPSVGAESALIVLPPTSTAGRSASNEVAYILEDSKFRGARTASERLLAVLGLLHERHPSDFRKVLTLRGRTRVYFANSEEELEQHGKSVDPKRIPGSTYWVIGNTENPRKVMIIEGVLNLLGYSSQASAVFKPYFPAGSR